MRYGAGDGYLVVGNGLVALLSPHAPERVAERLWSLTNGRARPTTALATILSPGFDAVGSFALAVSGSEHTTLYLRGDITAEFDGTTQSGVGQDTWLELHLNAGTVLQLSLDSGAADVNQPDAPHDVSTMPLHSGIVRADVVIGALVTDELAAQGTSDAAVEERTLQPGASDVAQPSPSEAPTPQLRARNRAHHTNHGDAGENDTARVEESPAVQQTEATEHETAQSEAAQSEATEHEAAEPTPVEDRDDVPAEVPAAPQNHPDEVTQLLADVPALENLTGYPSPNGQPATPPRYRLRLITGDYLDLDTPVLVGRAPHHAAVTPDDPIPQLLVVPSPAGDISRTHARIEQTPHGVVVTDLNSTNGLDIRTQFRPPVRPQPGVATLVEVGSVIDLGENALLTVETLA